MAEAIVVMTEKALGCLGVVDDNGYLKGIITDGDFRRHMGDGLLKTRAGNHDAGAQDGIARVSGERCTRNDQRDAITALFVVEDGRPVGIIHIHDLLRAGVA